MVEDIDNALRFDLFQDRRRALSAVWVVELPHRERCHSAASPLLNAWSAASAFPPWATSPYSISAPIAM